MKYFQDVLITVHLNLKGEDWSKCEVSCSIIHVCVCFFCVFHGLNRHGVHDRSELNAAIHDIFHNK